MARHLASALFVIVLAGGCTGGGEIAADAGPRADATASPDAARPRVGPPDAAFIDSPVDAAPTDSFLPPQDGGPGPLEMTMGTATVIAETAPPPLSGGTLMLTRDDRFAVAADSDRDRVVIIGLPTRFVDVVALSAGDEPGRLVEDAAGHVHVALRRGGAVVTIDPATHTLLGRRAVCPAPRGIAYDGTTDSLHVACAGGELVTLPSTLAPPTRTLQLDDDLRDVVVVGTDLFVSRFRSAQVLVVDAASGAITHRIQIPGSDADGTSAAVAWRMIASPSGGVTVIHQQAGAPTDVAPAPGGYGRRGCSTSIVRSAASEIQSPVAYPTTPVLLSPCATLPVDAATAPDGMLVVVAAGAAPLDVVSQLFGVARSAGVLTTTGAVPHQINGRGRITAIAINPSGLAVSQTREPSGLWFQMPGDPGPTYVALGGASALDTGYELFHSNVGIGLACASCHPEGGDDGRVWTFAGVGERRTMPLRGGLLGTEPFHWSGELHDFSSLVADVFGGRMSGGSLTFEHAEALGYYIDRNPLLPTRTPADPIAAARGQALFESAEVGCTSCHTGARLSDESTVDVGTGGVFQVPSLRGLADRAPYMHDGCAATLMDRFLPACGGGDLHGHTSSLSTAELQDLVAYLTTL